MCSESVGRHASPRYFLVKENPRPVVRMKSFSLVPTGGSLTKTSLTVVCQLRKDLILVERVPLAVKRYWPVSCRLGKIYACSVKTLAAPIFRVYCSPKSSAAKLFTVGGVGGTGGVAVGSPG